MIEAATAAANTKAPITPPAMLAPFCTGGLAAEAEERPFDCGFNRLLFALGEAV
jgi:hypothetical protein